MYFWWCERYGLNLSLHWHISQVLIQYLLRMEKDHWAWAFYRMDVRTCYYTELLWYDNNLGNRDIDRKMLLYITWNGILHSTRSRDIERTWWEYMMNYTHLTYDKRPSAQLVDYVALKLYCNRQYQTWIYIREALCWSLRADFFLRIHIISKKTRTKITEKCWSGYSRWIWTYYLTEIGVESELWISSNACARTRFFEIKFWCEKYMSVWMCNGKGGGLEEPGTYIFVDICCVCSEV